jgi:hypothetical protein
MYYYDIGYGTCEESSFVTLTHEKKVTQDDLHQMIKKICIELYQEFHTDSDQFTDDGEKWHSLEKMFDHCTFQDLWNTHRFPRDEDQVSIVDKLIKDYGFQRIKYEAEIAYFGWASLDKVDWTGHTDELTQDLQKAVIEVYGENTSERF